MTNDPPSARMLYTTGSSSSPYHIPDDKAQPSAANYFAYLYAKKTNEAYQKRFGKSMDLDALAALTGSATHAAEIACSTTTPDKKKATTMDVPKPKPYPCPACGNRAICDENGDDAVIELIDHANPTAKSEDRAVIVAGKETYAESGARARIRVCAKCGEVYASVLRVQEA